MSRSNSIQIIQNLLSFTNEILLEDIAGAMRIPLDELKSIIVRMPVDKEIVDDCLFLDCGEIDLFIEFLDNDVREWRRKKRASHKKS